LPLVVNIPVWQPNTVGNGRLLIIGDISSVSTNPSNIRWRVNGQDWETGVSSTSVPDEFAFWVHGYSPLPGTEFEPAWSPVSNHFEASSDREVLYLTNPSRSLIPKASSAAAVDTTPNSWFWEDGVIYFHPLGDSVSGEVPVTTPSFAESESVRLEIQTAGGDVLFDETFVWNWPVRDIVSHMIDTAAPSFLSDTQAARDIYFAQARAIGDIYSIYDDYALQSFPSQATWAVPVWEQFLGLPSLVSLSTQERSQIIEESIRGVGGLRTEFFKSLNEQVGSSIVVTDNYSTYNVVFRLNLSGTDADAAKYRSAAESLISRIKPAGIQTSVSYATFVSGVSRAGDAL